MLMHKHCSAVSILVMVLTDQRLILSGLDVVVQVEKLLEDQVERNTPIEKEAQDNFHHLGPAPSQLQCVIFIIGLIVFTFMLELSLVFVCVG